MWINAGANGAFAPSITDSIHLKRGAFRLLDKRCRQRARGNHWHSAVSEVSDSMLTSMSPLVSSTRADLLHPLISTWIV